MDKRLLAWGLRRRSRVPHLWLFTDSRRLPDPLGAVSRLPKGRAGVVFRNDAALNRAGVGLAIARICRDRRLWLVVAGDGRLAARLGAGVHLRGGAWPDQTRPRGFLTSSAHDVGQLRRAAAAGAGLVFVSPAFPTQSHPGASNLGPYRWAALARRAPAGVLVAALGGVDGRSITRLPPRLCAAAGAIGALA